MFTIEDYLNGNVPRGSPIQCPFHVDKMASATVMVDTGRFWCFRCQRGGNRVEIMREIYFKDEPYPTGILLAEVAVKQMKEIPFVEKPPFEMTEEFKDILTLFCKKCCLHLKERPHLVRDLQMNRGIKNPLKAGIGVADWDVYHDFLTEYEGDKTTLETLGINGKTTRDFRLGGRYIIPEIRNRKVTFYVARSVEIQHSIKYLNPPFPKQVFGYESLMRDTKNTWVTEGVFDLLPLIEAGEAGIACNGLGMNADVVQMLKNRKKPVYLAFDNDPIKDGVSPGQMNGIKQIARLRAEGIEAYLSLPPDPWKDLGEWVSHTSVESVIQQTNYAFSSTVGNAVLS